MTDISLLQSLGIIILSATVVMLFSRMLRIPTIVAYILTGLILGPGTGTLGLTETIEIIAEVGIVLLLFLVGLELSLDKIKDVGKTAFIAGGIQMAFSATGGFVIAALFGFSTLHAVMIGIAIMFSSTVVVVKLLETRGDIHALYGKISVGVLLVQDLVVVIVLTFVAGFGNPGELEFGSIAVNMGAAFVGMIVLVAVAMGAARWVLPQLFSWVARSNEALFIWSLCWCFAFVIGSELLNLSPEIGAFLAGISVAQLPYSHELRRRVHPLMNFFIAIFFVSLGIQMELGAAMQYLPIAAVIVAFTMLGKPFIFLVVLPRLGYGERTTFLTGITLSQISEFSFIFAALALTAGLIDEAILSLIGLTGLITFSISAFLIIYNQQLYARVEGSRLFTIFGARRETTSGERSRLHDHVVIVGINALSRHLVSRLMDEGETILVIDTDAEKLRDLPCEVLLGNADYISTLEEANFHDAKLLISTLQIEETNILLAYRCREANVPCSIHAFDNSLVADLRSLGTEHLMLSKNVGIKRLGRQLQEMGILV